MTFAVFMHRADSIYGDSPAEGKLFGGNTVEGKALIGAPSGAKQRWSYMIKSVDGPTEERLKSPSGATLPQ